MTTTPESSARYAPGMRIEVRDAEWVIRNVDPIGDAQHQHFALRCEGISGLVRGKEARFITKYEGDTIRILRPEETKLCLDDSGQFVKSRLFIESLLRRTSPMDNKVYLATDAAMDVLDYQLDPAIQALSSMRPRILIADGVGIGKTLEAGILVSELIARGRGKRILVLTVKSMLNQFQQEFWNRFSIPLTRLDSQGISRLEQRIPANHNPFLYVDKSIISIDTLKNDIQYRTYLEDAYWDIIIIDEAHNVAERHSRSQRNQLAQLLAKRSDALIMLTATPHDGRAESFASLLTMLDPLAIQDQKHYTKDDFIHKNLIIRRFKNDVRDQITAAFPEREVRQVKVAPTMLEEEAIGQLIDMKLNMDVASRNASAQTIDAFEPRAARTNVLFKTVLEKTLFSSPAACLGTIDTRLKTIARRLKTNPKNAPALLADQQTLEAFRRTIETLDKASNFSKYQELLRFLTPNTPSSLGWSGQDKHDRLVIFTESLKTLDFLEKELPKALGLKAHEIVTLRGNDKDKDLNKAVEKFNTLDSGVKLMLATDVASEGLNLHRFCHRLIHFDVPWSLMTFQQRNGRIDRYGQTEKPEIIYLQTMSNIHDKWVGDIHILDKLIEKDNAAHQNIGDPREFLGSVEEQENLTAQKIQGDLSDTASDFVYDPNDPLAFLTMLSSTPAPGLPTMDKKGKRRLIFKNDYEFAKTALLYRQAHSDRYPLEVEFEDAYQTITLNPPGDLMARLRYLPREVLPENTRFILSTDKAQIKQSIAESFSKPGSSWPDMQLLWEMHPVMQWLEDIMSSSFGRHTAPLLTMPDRLAEDETWVLLYGGFPNIRGFVPVNDWFAVRIQGDSITLHSRREAEAKLRWHDGLVNPAYSVDIARITAKLPAVVDKARQALKAKKATFCQSWDQERDQRLAEVRKFVGGVQQSFEQIKDQGHAGDIQLAIKDQATLSELEKEANTYIEHTYKLEENPFIQVVAVITGAKPIQ